MRKYKLEWYADKNFYVEKRRYKAKQNADVLKLKKKMMQQTEKINQNS